jgi:hypothetical protein
METGLLTGFEPYMKKVRAKTKKFIPDDGRQTAAQP